MSSHDTAGLHADQEERSANAVTGGRHEPAELVLRRLEARMAERGLRAHIYLTERSVVEFARRRKRTDRPLERYVGPEPVRRVLAELLQTETEPRNWLTRLHAAAAGRSRVPGPMLWNSPALVVTRAIASPALRAVLEHEPAYPAREDPTHRGPREGPALKPERPQLPPALGRQRPHADAQGSFADGARFPETVRLAEEAPPGAPARRCGRAPARPAPGDSGALPAASPRPRSTL